MLELDFKWPDLTSTGASSVVCNGIGLQWAQSVTIIIQKSSPTDTAVVGLEHAADSTSPFERLGSTAYALASSGGAQSITAQFAGPLSAVRPYVISKTASTTVVVVRLLAAS